MLPAVLKEVGDGPTDLPRLRLKEIGVDVSLPSAFDDWFLRCVNLDPLRRFPTAGEAVRALRLALAEAAAAPTDAIRQGKESGAMVVAGRKRAKRVAFPIVLGVVVLGSLMAIIGKSPKQPAPMPSDAASSIEPEVTSRFAVAPSVRDAQAEAADAAASATPLPNRNRADVPMPNPHPADSLRAAVAKTSLPVVPKQPMPIAPKLAASPAPSTRTPTASSSGASSAAPSEPPTIPRARRDPADHR